MTIGRTAHNNTHVTYTTQGNYYGGGEASVVSGQGHVHLTLYISSSERLFFPQLSVYYIGTYEFVRFFFNFIKTFSSIVNDIEYYRITRTHHHDDIIKTNKPGKNIYI